MALEHRGILRLGYIRAGLNDPRLEKSRRFYKEVIGMLETTLEGGRTYLRCWHEPHQFSLVIEETPENQLIEIGFEVRDQLDLDRITARVSGQDIEVESAGANTALNGLGPSIAFKIPGGQRLRLYYHMQQPGYVTGYSSPDWNVPKLLRGKPAPLFLVHCGITSPNPAETIAFLTDVLEFGVAEKILTDDGHSTLSALLFRSAHGCGHDLAVFPGEAGKLHHIAFNQEDETEILQSGTYLREDGVKIDIYGPTRQSYGKTFSLHFFDDCGIRNELCAGGRLNELHPEFMPVNWTEANLAKALSYFDNNMNEGFLTPSI
ncbi:MAG: VOC family protein [Gammaproteobacteria bacterium]|nr:VOC family protein [Gammaproteobacteria bacterium]